MLWKWNFQRLVPEWNSGTRKNGIRELGKLGKLLLDANIFLSD
jgi:hypothetical protein